MPRVKRARGFFYFNNFNIYIMKNLLETSFFALLAEGSRASVEDERFVTAIREFVGELREESEVEDDLVVRERMLESTRVGLEYWLERVAMDDAAGKKWRECLLLYQRGVETGGGGVSLVT